MPIILSSSSVQRRREFERGLLHLIQLDRVKEGFSVNPHPVPVYGFGIRDILGKTSFPAGVKPVSWQYLAAASSGETVSGEVDSGDPPKLKAISHGGPGRQFLETSDSLPNRPDLADKTFEVRLLRIPGILVEAFWLKPPGPEPGLIIPYRTLLRNLEPSRAYTSEEFLREIQEAATRTLTFSDSPLSPPDSRRKAVERH